MGHEPVAEKQRQVMGVVLTATLELTHNVHLPWDYNRDVVLFDDILAAVTTNLCIDESRVFTTGFSFGAMMSYALSIGRATKLRAAVTMAAANYNFTQPTNAKTPIAYFGITGMSDGTCPFVNSDSAKTGGKYCVLQHATDNGCTIPGTITTATVGSKKRRGNAPRLRRAIPRRPTSPALNIHAQRAESK